jgi:hypothetical protein
MSLRTMQPNRQGMACKGCGSPASAVFLPAKATAFSGPRPGSGPSVRHLSHVGGKCEPAHARIGKSSVRSESEGVTEGRVLQATTGKEPCPPAIGF